MTEIKKRLIVGISALLCLVSSVLPASAVQSPVACNSNRLGLSISKDKTSVQQGDTITYTVTVTNVDSLPAVACDIDGANVTVTLPAMDGTPTGTIVTLATGASYPAGFPITVIGTVSYVINVNPGVVDIIAQGRVTGILHDAPVDHAAEIIKTVGTAVITPAAVVTPPATSASTGIPKLPNVGAPSWK